MMLGRNAAAGLAMLSGLVLTGCADSSGPTQAPRTYRMGFSPITPRFDETQLAEVLALTAAHSDIGLHQIGIPWSVLLSGITAAAEVRTVRLPLADYYPATGRPVVVALDVTDGLNRAQEAPELITAGRSITDPVIQRL